MRFPNLLASKGGRLTAFFFLYVTEGIPLGFTATAVAAQMRREDVSVAAIGAFIGTLYLPWSFKWLMGPLVDNLQSEKLGRRRAWIVGCQILMVAMLFSSMLVDFSTELKLFTALILVVNIFGATQDVAIDALACEVLPEKERGSANGLMFAGAYIGNGLGGAGVLALTDTISFSTAALLAIGSILFVTVFIGLPLREKRRPDKRKGVDMDGHVESEVQCVGCGASLHPVLVDDACTACGMPATDSVDQHLPNQRQGMNAVVSDICSYVNTAIRAFLSSRGAILALLFAMLPCGAYALSLVAGNSLAIEMGMRDGELAEMGFYTIICAAGGCVLGGLLSDQFGRRKMLAIYLVLTAIPTIALAVVMNNEGWVNSFDVNDPLKPDASEKLVVTYYMIAVAYATFHGLMYGTRTALFMDVCDPKVAATQFTAYMAILNFVIFYTSTWQGHAIVEWGYPTTLAIDGVIGLGCIALLPWIRKPKKDEAEMSDSSDGITDKQPS